MEAENNETGLLVVDHAPVTPEVLQRQVNAIQHAMEKVMKRDVHYGVIPGCGDKPALLKAGAEKLGLMFRLIPTFDITVTTLGNGHKEYNIKCTLKDPRGNVMGQGVGSCSTMESKYRYRKGAGENTGREVPKDYWNGRNPELLGGKGFLAKKDENGKWMIFTAVEKAENPDIADQYNTTLKMAKKRSHVDAIITTTAASDIFTQDIDETVEVVSVRVEEPKAPTSSVVAADKLTTGTYLYDLSKVPPMDAEQALDYVREKGAKYDAARKVFVSPTRLKILAPYEVKLVKDDPLPESFS